MSAWGALVLTVMLGARNKDGMRNMTMNLTKVILPIFVYPLSLNSPYCIKLWANFFIGIRVDQHIGVLESQDRNFKIRNYKNQQNPVDAFPIHGGCGPIGAQFPGWSNAEKGIFMAGCQIMGYPTSGHCGLVRMVCNITFNRDIFFLKIMGLLNVSRKLKQKRIEQCSMWRRRI